MHRLAVLALAVALAIGAIAQGATPAGASDVDRIRRQADAAAEAFLEASERLDELEAEVADLEAKAADAETRLTSLRRTVHDLAIDRYVAGGSPVLRLLGELEDPNQAARASVLTEVAAGGARQAIDAFRAAGMEYRESQVVLERAAERRAAAVERLRGERDRLAARLAELEAIEARRRQEAQARAARQTPIPSTPAPAAGSGWVCPVAGARAFTNDWGSARSGGRRHQGTDIFAAAGTPVVAPVAGTVRHRSNSLGGLAFWLTGADGVSYYGAHLSGFGQAGAVTAGTVIGYVGSSGNARGAAPHLHFEMHPGGRGAVNPYPTLRGAC